MSQNVNVTLYRCIDGLLPKQPDFAVKTFSLFAVLNAGLDDVDGTRGAVKFNVMAGARLK